MATWRERGEVLDSDSEDDTPFTSQDNCPTLPKAVHESPLEKQDVAAVAAAPANPGIWDFPNSSPNVLEAQNGPLAGCCQRNPSTPPPQIPLTATDGSASSPLSSLSSLSSIPAEFEDDIADTILGEDNGQHRGQEIAVYFRSTSDAPIGYVELSSLPPPVGIDANSTESTALSHTEDQLAARRAAIRYERSLRPRKPIQEHPYLLEGARYAHVLKEHGIRPVRVATHQNRAGENQEDDSQEREYEEESQDVRDGAQLASQDTESLGDAAEEKTVPDPYRLPSSPLIQSPSPISTSPVGGAIQSSGDRSANKTDNTSILDEGEDREDLPSLEEILNPLSRSVQTANQKRRTAREEYPKRKRLKRGGRNSRHLESTPLIASTSAYGSSISAILTPVPRSSSPLPAPPPRFQIPNDGRKEGHKLSTASVEAHASLEPSNRVTEAIGDPSHPATLNMTPWDSQDSDTDDGIHDLRARRSSSGSNSSPEETDLKQNKARRGRGRQPSSFQNSDSESGSEIIRAVGRRIKGVLPASWLRLDQKSSRDKVRQVVTRRPLDSLDEAQPRRGLAQPKLRQASSAAPARFFDESDEDETQSPHLEQQFKSTTQDVLLVEDVDDDDPGPVMEDNHIDAMRPTTNRERMTTGQRPRSAKSKATGVALQRGKSIKSRRQPRITSMLGSSRTNIPAQRRPGSLVRGLMDHPSPTTGQTMLVPSLPPQLSILDVLTADAPKFVKIAARTARRRTRLGKSDPWTKRIRLATRRDNLEAQAVLQDWKTGKIIPRVSLPKRLRPRQESRPALQEVSPNVLSIAPIQSGSVWHRSTDHYENPKMHFPYGKVGSKVAPNTNTRTAERVAQQTRPAQLETRRSTQSRRSVFSSHKRALDELFRRTRQPHRAPSSVGSHEMSTSDAQDVTPVLPSGQDSDSAATARPSPSKHGSRGSRFRKQTRPTCVDLAAPQYAHANDPIPVEVAPLLIETATSQTSKLQGLGPFGTYYTHHFEVFPLDQGVYFHETTILGSGCLEVVTESHFFERLGHARTEAAFNLGGRTLRWGPWSDQVSSELGILLDWISEKLRPESMSVGSDCDVAAEAARFVFKYVQNSLSLPTDDARIAFVSRIVETFSGFSTQIRDALSARCGTSTSVHERSIIDVLIHLVLVAFVVLSICRHSRGLVSEGFAAEEILKTMSQLCIRQLLKHSSGKLRDLYDRLQERSFEERGIRGDEYIAHAWVILMRVLEISHIPRASFWDTTQSIMLQEEPLAEVLNVQSLERLWRSMFLLLPLSEFDNSGVVVAGLRHHTSMDGWTLPQRILKRVFQLYEENTRQSAGFNDYCRALVSRCHYLVQQWGWRRCNGIIGVIFDFFGSQNLAHLRNEEVYRSPRFLEMLPDNPSLSIEPEDRCFHIFLKLLAVVLKRLAQTGSMNDMRNLVARTMPNHNRQHHKEQTIHQHDLAALRNHHDLLCTLFWAAPPELRPQPHTIEKLVVPASSHKEACLINLRAWNQLSRFVASSEEGIDALLPFIAWQTRVFQQLVDQYDGVESDLHQQLLALSKDVSKGISTAMVESMVSTNKAAVLDVLYFSVKAAVDVMERATSVDVMTAAINPESLCLIFKHFFFTPPDMDWSILHVALSGLDRYLDRLDRYQSETSQHDSYRTAESSTLDEAVFTVDDRVAGDFFSMARCLLAAENHSNVVPALDGETASTRLLMIVSGKLTANLMRSGIIGSTQVFTHGKYGLFESSASKFSLRQRKFLCLFVSVLLEQGVTDLTNVGFTLLELWLLCIVKPRRYLMFENRLGEQLKLRGCDFLPEAIIGLATAPGYSTSRDLFQFAVSWMRHSLRDASPHLRKQLITEFSLAISKVMQHLKADLKILSSDNAEHISFVEFVRDIISLIKSHCTDICTVDDFFYQISSEYSPPMQDPQLHVAGIISYGIRLSEGDSRVTPELFYYLYSNFKVALANDRLPEEAIILKEGMKNPGILSFILGTMLPAITQAVVSTTGGYPILDVYCHALRGILIDPVAPQEVPESDEPRVTMLLRTILDALWAMKSSTQGGLSHEQTHIITQLTSVMDAMRLTCDTLRLNNQRRTSIDGLQTQVDKFGVFSRTAEWYMNNLLETHQGFNVSLTAELLLEGLDHPVASGASLSNPLTAFAEHIVKDITSTWTFSDAAISIKAPTRSRGPTATDGSCGTRRPSWDAAQLARDLYGQLHAWNDWYHRGEGTAKTEIGWKSSEYLIL